MAARRADTPAPRLPPERTRSVPLDRQSTSRRVSRDVTPRNSNYNPSKLPSIKLRLSTQPRNMQVGTENGHQVDGSSCGPAVINAFAHLLVDEHFSLRTTLLCIDCSHCSERWTAVDRSRRQVRAPRPEMKTPGRFTIDVIISYGLSETVRSSTRHKPPSPPLIPLACIAVFHARLVPNRDSNTPAAAKARQDQQRI